LQRFSDRRRRLGDAALPVISRGDDLLMAAVGNQTGCDEIDSANAAEAKTTMGKILIGVATAALWFVLAHAANAEPACSDLGAHLPGVAVDIGR